MLDASAASSALHVKLSRWHQASTLTPNGGAGAGVLVALGTGISGRVPLTEIHDGLALNVLEGLRAGQAVRASVLQPADKSGRAKKAGRHQLLLSLRPLKGGAVGGFKRLKAAAGLQSDITIPTSMKAANLSANAQVGTRSLHVPHTRTHFHAHSHSTCPKLQVSCAASFADVTVQSHSSRSVIVCPLKTSAVAALKAESVTDAEVLPKVICSVLIGEKRKAMR